MTKPLFGQFSSKYFLRSHRHSKIFNPVLVKLDFTNSIYLHSKKFFRDIKLIVFSFLGKKKKHFLAKMEYRLQTYKKKFLSPNKELQLKVLKTKFVNMEELNKKVLPRQFFREHVTLYFYLVKTKLRRLGSPN